MAERSARVLGLDAATTRDRVTVGRGGLSEKGIKR